MTMLSGGARFTLWSAYEASVDWSNLEHVLRVLRVYESFLIELSEDDITTFTRVLEVDGFSVDASRKITMVGGALLSIKPLWTGYAPRFFGHPRRFPAYRTAARL